MLNFKIKNTPPTLVEMRKEQSRIYWNSVLFYCLAALSLLACAVTTLPLVRALPIFAFAVHVVLTMPHRRQWEDLKAISKADCIEIAKGLDQPSIADYCAKVATQGRELVIGERDLINCHMRLNGAGDFKPKTEAELEAACKKVYGVATS